MRKTKSAYCLVSADLRMVLNVALDVLTPDDRVIIIRVKELHDIFSPSFNGVKPFLAKDIGQVSLDRDNCGSGDVVTENPKRGDGL